MSSLHEPFSHRLKNKVLGAPLHTEQLAHERLGKPTALAVFASDNLSSSAYASEEILRVLLVFMGVAAFSLVVPITIALLVVLGFLILSYRQTIKAYPSAGGAYIVTRDNFGIMPAQVAGVALLTDYILTVSVSVAAGSDALASTFPSLSPYTLWIAIAFIGIIAYGNLRGVKESGKVFAVPTYFFIVNMFVLIGVGTYKVIFSSLPKSSSSLPGMVKLGNHHSSGLLMGATAWVALKAFGSGGAAVTGVEAISNGVPAFHEPAWKNARETLVIMGVLLGIMFLGLSIFAARVHATPYESGTPTVISQVAKFVYGGGFGNILYYSLNAGTMLILVLAANTSFADFPRLASFHAGDNFMPRQFMVRGHRLVFSNGIIFLAGAGIVTLLATGGKVSRLIPLYAIGVFTSFTMSQAGMAKHHITHKEAGWKTGLFINAMGAVLSFVVLVIVASVKFKEGAWVIMLLVPIMVVGLVRLNKAYVAEDAELHEDAANLAQLATKRRHTLIVLVDNLDAAAARALQYARTIRPDELRAVHFDLDPWKTQTLTTAWQSLGFSRFPLDIVECTDRRMPRAALEMVSELLLDGETEVSVLIPRREYTKGWHRLLHDNSSGGIIDTLSQLAHCNVTVVPYHLGAGHEIIELPTIAKVGTQAPGVPDQPEAPIELRADGTHKIGQVALRRPATVVGRVRAMRIQPWGGNPSLECTLADETGIITLVFTGRREIPGVRLGTVLKAQGTVANLHHTTGIMNPIVELLSVPEAAHSPSEH